MRVLHLKADGTVVEEQVHNDESGSPLDDLNRLVGGHLELLPFPMMPGVVGYCNEEGLLKKLPENKSLFNIRGDAVLIGTTNEGEETDLPAAFTVKNWQDVFADEDQ